MQFILATRRARVVFFIVVLVIYTAVFAVGAWTRSHREKQQVPALTTPAEHGTEVIAPTPQRTLWLT